MGKQINYYMGYSDFLTVAQTALDNGSVIYRHQFKNGHWKISGGTDIGIILPDCIKYYFHFPEFGEISFTNHNGNEHISFESQLSVIEAGFSIADTGKRLINRNRLYVTSGLYNKDDEYIERDEQLTKIYNKLVRKVKKLAPLREFECISSNPRCEGQKYLRKEYMSQEYFELLQNDNYTLG